MSVLFKDKLTGFWRRAASNLIYASFPVGSIVAYGGSSDADAPAGCMYCHGQVLNASDYPELYDVIGTKFGTGDGSTGSFSLPDLQGQFLRGAGTNRDSTQGNGGTVGTRQKATEADRGAWTTGTYNTDANIYSQGDNSGPDNYDKSSTAQMVRYDISAVTGRTVLAHSTMYKYSVRPTNTSVEWIIKVVK